MSQAQEFRYRFTIRLLHIIAIVIALFIVKMLFDIVDLNQTSQEIEETFERERKKIIDRTG